MAKKSMRGMDLMLRLDYCSKSAQKDLDWMMDTAIALHFNEAMDAIQGAVTQLRCLDDILSNTKYGRFMGTFEAEEYRPEQ